MPYAGPDSPPTIPRARNHRRSYSFTDEKGPGAFVSLGALPRAQRKAPPPKLTAFHFQDDDEDDSPEDDTHKHLSINTYNLRANERATPNGRSSPPKNGLTDPATVPFPTSSPSQEETLQLTLPQRPPLSRGSSHPIFLSNGKPLKSSLKSSPSTSSIPDGRSMHLRVRSAPTTPFLSKNVHFPEKKEDGLESVRVFSLKAKPASLSQSGGDDTETETETESIRFPVPRSGGTYSLIPGRFPLNFDIDYESPGATSAIPTPNPPAYANIHFESVAFEQSASPSSPLVPSSPHLTGTILVRNVAYEKHVAVRFTLDDWQTTSEVSAHHVESVPVPPWETTQSCTLGDAVGLIANASSAPSTWDRFSFSIRLDDYAYKLHQRVLWLVGRYTTTGDGGGVWWDNNSGSNYRIGFKVKTAQGRTVSAPEPVVRTTNADLTSRQGFRSGFEFQTTMPSQPPSDGREPSHTSSSTSYFSTQTLSIPPPPVPRAPQRQPRLSLVNYAAPSVSPTTTGPRRSPLNSPPLSTVNAPNPFFAPKVRLTPPSSPKDERGRKQTGWSSSDFAFGGNGNMQTIIGGQPATSSFFEPRSKSITLKWPWGLGSNFTSDSNLRSDYGSSSDSDSPRLRSSPENASPLSSTTPSISNSGSSEGSGTSSPIDTDSDQLYNTFVKQWCFAQSPRPGPSHNGLSTTDAFTEGVLVG